MNVIFMLYLQRTNANKFVRILFWNFFRLLLEMESDKSESASNSSSSGFKSNKRVSDANCSECQIPRKKSAKSPTLARQHIFEKVYDELQIRCFSFCLERPASEDIQKVINKLNYVIEDFAFASKMIATKLAQAKEYFKNARSSLKGPSSLDQTSNDVNYEECSLDELLNHFYISAGRLTSRFKFHSRQPTQKSLIPKLEDLKGRCENYIEDLNELKEYVSRFDKTGAGTSGESERQRTVSESQNQHRDDDEQLEIASATNPNPKKDSNRVPNIKCSNVGSMHGHEQPQKENLQSQSDQGKPYSSDPLLSEFHHRE
ncbi:uncharacterized protein LOC129576169 [Sitodiplosis mosellana]|uniref:uncharacterized protein LOC129576169 n=1 Tax=Sitodiplosis mosellana TaxID=263140 RepID=UPI00244480EC|nr:uncharacterized protein LOC129576169 [Sitodiplosis mosellana]XP_055316802.1 uncharacterized protein LOC129576169 [Sitodiplosis mosellana]XP_055316803.1 uncharacterized protein LOC129576169 [Sitodiplosis mosellana]XP_055316804.1 uncharacterized protein LOC129576169 [Sitodiplosis mosellana]